MSQSLRRAVPVSLKITPASAAPAEPAGEKVRLLMMTLDSRGKLVPYGTMEILADRLEQVADALEVVAASQPDDSIQLSLGRPATRLIVIKINSQDPNFIGGDNKLALGEVVTVPELVELIVGYGQGEKTSAPLVRYYLKQHKPYEQCGYTFQDMEDFKRELAGPSGKHLRAIANAHVAWAQANHQESLT